MEYAGAEVTRTELKIVRVRLGMTQKQLAEALGISPGRVGDYERGYTRGKNRKDVQVPRLVELACEMLLVQRERGEI